MAIATSSWMQPFLARVVIASRATRGVAIYPYEIALVTPLLRNDTEVRLLRLRPRRILAMTITNSYFVSMLYCFNVLVFWCSSDLSWKWLVKSVKIWHNLYMKYHLKKLSPTLFWDVSADDLKPQRHARFIIGRVLKFGDIADWQIISRWYNRRTLRRAAKLAPDLDLKSRALWRVVLGK